MSLLARMLLRVFVPMAVLGGGILVAAYQGAFDYDGPLADTPLVGPDSLTARLPFVDDGLPDVDITLEGATNLLAGVPLDPTGATFEQWTSAAASLTAAGIDPGDLLTASDQAQIVAASQSPSAIDALNRESDALAGGTYGNSKPVDPDDQFRAFFVNGIMNTARDAEAGRLALQQALGVDVTLYYNHSSVETAELEADFCRRALGLEDRVADGSTAGLATSLCEGAEGVTGALSTLLEGIRGAAEVSAMRVFGIGTFLESAALADLSSQAVNDELVTDIEAAVEAGTPVALVGHSQGTLFVSNAMQQTQAWWDGLVADGRACGANPVGGLYISPAFNAVTTANQRYVELPNDMLLVTGVTSVQPTIELYGAQAQMNPLDLHSLSTYLMARSNSRADIEAKFAAIEEYARAHAGATVIPSGPTITSTIPVVEEVASVAPGGSTTIAFRLPCRPESTVTLRIAVVSGGGPVTASPAVIEVTPNEWHELHEITVTAAADAPLGTAAVGITADSIDSFYATARDAIVSITVQGEAAVAAGQQQAAGALDLAAGLQEGLTAALELATAQMPAEGQAAVRQGWPSMVEQILAGFSTKANEIQLIYPGSGGPVLGSIDWAYEFAAPVAPGLPSCVISVAAHGQITGTFDASTGTFRRTVHSTPDVRVEGCQGTVAPIPPPAGESAEWSATLMGGRIEGMITDGSSGTVVTTPFTAQVE